MATKKTIPKKKTRKPAATVKIRKKKNIDMDAGMAGGVAGGVGGAMGQMHYRTEFGLFPKLFELGKTSKKKK